MEPSKIIIISIICFIFIGCNDSILNDNFYSKNSDYDLINEIQSSSEKINVEYSELPTSIISVVESSFSNKLFISQYKVLNVGYELTYSEVGNDEDFFKQIFFDYEGKKLVPKKNDKECFELSYPIGFKMQDDSVISVSNAGDWFKIKNWYTNNLNYNNRPELEYPVSIVYEDNSSLLINNEEEMIQAKFSCNKCLELIYPITFIFPDGSTIAIIENTEQGWEELKNWYEQNLTFEFDWNIQFPLDIKFQDGSFGTVDSFLELSAIKEMCRNDF